MKPLFWLNKYWHANRVLFEMKEDYESERERERMAAFTHNSGSIMSNAYVNELMKRSHMMADCMSICCVSLPNQNLISMGFCDLWTKFRRTDRQTNNHVFNSVELHTRHTLKKGTSKRLMSVCFFFLSFLLFGPFLSVVEMCARLRFMIMTLTNHI